MPKGLLVDGKKIAARRLELFLTQPQVARATGMSTENVKRIERDARVGMGQQYLGPLAEALKMPLEKAAKAWVVQGMPINGTRPRRVLFELGPSDYERLEKVAAGRSVGEVAREMVLQALRAVPDGGGRITPGEGKARRMADGTDRFQE